VVLLDVTLGNGVRKGWHIDGLLRPQARRGVDSLPGEKPRNKQLWMKGLLWIVKDLPGGLLAAIRAILAKQLLLLGGAGN